VVEGQRLMQAASDIFLGWSSTKGHEYYVRQFRDMKVSAVVETFKPSTLVGYATLCGWALARAHAKTGGAAQIAGYLGSSEQFDDALVQYSAAYADQAERDFTTFQAAIRSGRLSTEPAKETDLEFSM
jgi:NAD(P)H-dependent flavin oxidoreductase YrpB (nitropropane dioxygenase family)